MDNAYEFVPGQRVRVKTGVNSNHGYEGATVLENPPREGCVVAKYGYVWVKIDGDGSETNQLTVHKSRLIPGGPDYF